MYVTASDFTSYRVHYVSNRAHCYSQFTVSGEVCDSAPAGFGASRAWTFMAPGRVQQHPLYPGYRVIFALMAAVHFSSDANTGMATLGTTASDRKSVV